MLLKNVDMFFILSPSLEKATIEIRIKMSNTTILLKLVVVGLIGSASS